MKFDTNLDICFLCGSKVFTSYDIHDRIQLNCNNHCFEYIDGKSFIIDKSIFIKNKFPNIYIYFYCLEESQIFTNDWKYIHIFDIVNKEDIKHLSQIEIINKFINYCENLVFL